MKVQCGVQVFCFWPWHLYHHCCASDGDTTLVRRLLMSLRESPEDLAQLLAAELRQYGADYVRRFGAAIASELKSDQLRGRLT